MMRQLVKKQLLKDDETAAETKSRLDSQKKLEAYQAEAEVKKAARQVILDKLGLTTDEAQLLFG
jgi:hypothetical protein